MVAVGLSNRLIYQCGVRRGWCGSGWVVMVVVVMLLHQPVPAQEARTLTSLFSTKLGELYKLRQSLQDAAGKQPVTTTSTTTTPTFVTATPSNLFISHPEWSMHGAEVKKADDVYLSLSNLFDLQKLESPSYLGSPVPTYPRPSAVPQPRPSVVPQSRPSTAPKPRPSTAPQPRPSTAPQPRPSAAPQPRPSAVPQSRPSIAPQPRPSAVPQSHSSTAPQLRPSAVPQPHPSTVPQPRPYTAPQPRPSVVPQPRSSTTPQSRPSTAPQPRPSTTPQSRPSTASQQHTQSPSTGDSKEIYYGKMTSAPNVNDVVTENFLESRRTGNGTTVADEDVTAGTHWTRIKSIFENMKSILQQMYPPGSNGEKMSFSIFDNIIAVGDKVHVLNRMRETFDGELLDYLYHKWEDVKASVVGSNTLLQAVLSSDTQGVGQGLLMALVRQVGSILQSQAFTHISELDFVTELMRSSGFKDAEIYQVFKLLNLPTTTVEVEEDVPQEGRQYAWGLDKSGGYGHSGGGGGGGYGGGGGGGGYMQSFDPFVLLAGLAFATFLAYLIYRLLSSTTGGRRREVPDITLALDLSDLPSVVNNIYTWLENTEVRYAGSGKTLEEEYYNFGWAANQLWLSYQVDRLSHACVKRFMCDYVTNRSSGGDLVESGSLVEELALSGMAHLFGEESAATTVDQAHSWLLEGEDPHCATLAPQCDDVAYPGIGNKTTLTEGPHKEGLKI